MKASSNIRAHRIIGAALKYQKGAISVLYVFMLPVLLGFAVLAIDVGSWYAVKAELSKSVDAAAFAGAASIASSEATTLAQDFGKENFPSGLLGTKALATFTATLGDHTIRVTGSVPAPTYLAKIFGINQVTVGNAGAAKKNKVEIMLVLDESGSMNGTPITDLKSAAKAFVTYFADTQAEDKMGLISFATVPTVKVPLENNFVTDIKNKVDGIKTDLITTKCSDCIYTNSEDAIAAVGGSGGLSDQSLVAADLRVQQFLIFFTDGDPTAFSAKFKNQGQDIANAVVKCADANCTSYTNYLLDPVTGAKPIDPQTKADITVIASPTGNGESTSAKLSNCTTGTGKNKIYNPNTRWYTFSDANINGIAIYGIANPTDCRTSLTNLSPLPCSATGPGGYDCPKVVMNICKGKGLGNYIGCTGRLMAIHKAQALKDRFVKVYIIGLSMDLYGKQFLSQIASGPTYEYQADGSADLQPIFNTIAKDIKLRLIE